MRKRQIKKDAKMIQGISAKLLEWARRPDEGLQDHQDKLILAYMSGIPGAQEAYEETHG